ncbi:MAG: hypothetical protein ACOCV2_13985, partial [Persicimonas sp.]
MSWTYVTCSPDIPSRGLLGSGTICLAALGLFGVLFAGGAHAAQETSFAERLEERERAIERHRRAAEETEARIAATEAGIDEDLSSPQTAVRARQRVRARLVDHFVAWDRQRRRLRRAEGQPDLAASADTRALLA